MVELNISRIPILPLGMVNAHLIEGSRGCVLVDAGLPNTEQKFATALAKRGRTFRDIKLIVITHAHVDHAGGAARLRDLTGAPILAQAGDMPYFNRSLPMSFCPTGWFGRVFLKTRLMFDPYVGFEPDILLPDSNGFDLAPFGVNGMVKHTPGHTAGSISVELHNKEALVGDLIASGMLLGGIARIGRAKRPPFEDNPLAVANALQSMVHAGMEKFHMGHGGPLNANEVLRHAHILKTLKPH